MFTTRPIFSLATATFALLVHMLFLPESRADFLVKVANTTDTPQTLDDLIAFDKNGKKDEIVPSSKGLAGVTIPRRETKEFFTSLDDIAKIEVSQFIDGKEAQSTSIKVVGQTEVVALIDDPNGLISVFLDINYDLYNFSPPSVGTILNYTDGLNPATPGWFVGTSINNDTGDITDPFTGDIRIVSTSFAVTAEPIPEPSTLILLGTGAFSLLGYRWRCRKRGTSGVSFPRNFVCQG